MSYKSTTIASIVQKLNKRYFIPAIQRPYVWEEQQITKLLDSLMKGYPIGTFLFWEVLGEYKENWEFYRFVEHYRQGEIPNEKVQSEHDNEVVLVLDGQQRLTSLLIALVGTYTMKQKYKRRHNTTAWRQRSLYLNLLKSPEVSDDDSIAEDITYGFAFHEDAPKANTGVWLKLSDVMGFVDDEVFEDYSESLTGRLEDAGVSNIDRRLVRRNLERLYRVVWKDEIVCFYTEHTQSYDKVLDIFVRVNSGGEVLSKSDLLMSLVTLKWDRFDAREELARLQKRLNEELTTPNDFDRDFILRTALLLSELPYVFSVDSFTKKNLALIESNWTEIKASLEIAIRLVNRFGLSNLRGNLTSNNAVMPIAHYVFRLRQKGLSAEAVEEILAANSRSIRVWVVSALFAGVFGGAADTTVVLARRIVDDASTTGSEFPINELVARMAARGRSAAWDEERIDQYLEMPIKSRVFLPALGLLYQQDDWETFPHQRVNVFPNDSELAKGRMDAAGSRTGRVANMVLLTGDELVEFKELGHEEWLYTRTDAQRAEHLIPLLDGYEVDQIDEFLSERERLIGSHLSRLTNTGVLAPVEY